MTFELHRHDARHISTLLAPNSVDLIVTSPPYFALRSYQDACPFCDGTGAVNPTSALPCPECNGTGRGHYDGQLGSEPTPGEFVDALIECTRDWLKVLRPSGSIWVNLGDKYAGSGGHNNNGLTRSLEGIGKAYAEGDAHVRGVGAVSTSARATRRNAPDRYNQNADGIRPKSLMGLPWRYALRCVDELGLILRAEVIWSKPNGLPESVTDRVRRSHEQFFHFTREGRYFAAIDEVREPSEIVFTAPQNGTAWHARAIAAGEGHHRYDERTNNPLGKAPGSVWVVPSEPLVVPDDLGVDHFAAFPSELPRRIILGWSPTGYCTACGEARRAVVDKHNEVDHDMPGHRHTRRDASEPDGNSRGINGPSAAMRTVATITGYVCACTDTNAPTRPATVLDPFNGTGTVPAVAHHLGRHGIGTDLSADYLRLAEWRCTSDGRLCNKVLDRTGIPIPEPPTIDGQLDLFTEGGAP